MAESEEELKSLLMKVKVESEKTMTETHTLRDIHIQRQTHTERETPTH